MRRAVLPAAFAALVFSGLAEAAPPAPNARAFVVENGTTGEVLAQSNGREQLPIASITKLMTVLLTLERAKLDEVVTVPAEVTTVGESTAELEAGQRLTVRELVEAALVPSANDAADTLAYYVGKGDQTAFVSLMNARARALGLRSTHFVRPEGLDPGDVSSAHDVTRLARMLMGRPAVRGMVRERSVTVGGRTFDTRNNLLSTFPGAIGVKTGHTSAAGWSEVAAARRNGVTVYATLLGSPAEFVRDADLAQLLDWGLSRYRPAVLVDPHRVYARAETAFGRGLVPLVAERRLVGAVHAGRPLVERVVVPAAVRLPVERGRPLGEVRVYQSGRLLGRRPLVAAKSVSRPSLAGRVGWYAGRTFHHLFGWLG